MATKGAWWKAALWGWVVVALMGCTGGDQASDEITPKAVVPTNTVAPIVRPSITPVPSWTPLPPSLTPLPTLPPDEAEALVLELLETNGGCELPCWWGFVPGETTWETFLSLITLLDGDLNINHIEEEEFIAIPRIPNPFGTLPSYPSYLFLFRDGILNAIEIFDYFDSPDFTFVEVIAKYGEPSLIEIRTYKTEYDGGMPIGMVLSYSDIGLAFEYKTFGELNDGIVHGCFSLTRKPFIWAWDPKSLTTLFDVWDLFGMEYERWPFMTIDKAAGISNSDFYRQTRINPESACLETPAELWPVQ